MSTNLYELHARAKAGMPDTWKVYLFEHMPPQGPHMYTSLTGAVVPTITRGPNKGRPNWKKKDESTVRAVVVTPAEHDAFVARWEAETGKCSRCMGRGDVPWKVEKVDGVYVKTRRECPVCGGSGAAKGSDVVATEATP